ncbi:MAG: hypothetical protein V2J07_02310, partial [Anaerolineae bacterium]|nr:hypothetical protein [Anaerolineae bacterium]
MAKLNRKRLLLGTIVGFIVFLVWLGPLLVPVPPIPGAVPALSFADADSQFIDIDGYRLHYKEMGDGEPVFLLLHGLGPGLFTWQALMPSLSEYG